LLRAGVFGVAIAVALFAWLATREGGEDSTASEAESRIVSEAELSETAAILGQPVYWAGPVLGTELELSELGAERGVQVRYLPQGSEAGSAENVLTIGSYPLADPAAALESVAERPGAIVRHTSDGREVVSNERQPTSVYFSSPDNSVQVEVYDPSARRAMALALSGKVEPAH
jgi:hypothetical protein